MAFSAVVFDLDGTLADTLRDLADSVNDGLTKLSQPTWPVEAYRLMVGEGRRTLCQRALSADRQDLVDELETLMTAYYADHCFDFTAPYRGIMPMLQTLEQTKVRLAVLSNKPDPFVQLTIQKLFPTTPFEVVLGEHDDLPRKPDPAGAIEVARRMKLSPGDVAYVGDTWIDMQTANGAGMFAIGVTWGFRDRDELQRSGAKVIVDTTDELLRILLDGKSK